MGNSLEWQHRFRRLGSCGLRSLVALGFFLIVPPEPRKEHLQILFCNNQLVGIGGAGAPHLYRLDRLSDVPGSTSATLSCHVPQRLCLRAKLEVLS